MTKSELVKRLKNKYPHLYLKEAEHVVNLVFDQVSNSLVTGGRVELRGFASFSTRQRKPRMAHNPRTGEKVKLGTRRAVYFRAGKEMRDRVNKG